MIWNLVFDIFRYGFLLFFVGMHSAMWLGIFLERRREKQPGAQDFSTVNPPLVSVIVPVRNEAARIKPLLASLAKQNYSRLEYIFIDDDSSDDSVVLLREFQAKTPNTAIITLRENPGKNRKQFALAKGIDASGGAVLLFTDADCEAGACWVRAVVETLCKCADTGAVLGPVLKKWGANGGSFFERYQCYDHAVRYLYLAGTAGLGQAGGGFGNNLAVKREAMEAAGGYAAVQDSPTEDAALVAVIRAKTKYQVRAVFRRELQVLTAKEDSWPAMLNQTLRWHTGGLESPDAGTRFSYSVLMYMITAGGVALFLLPAIPKIWPLFASIMFVMLPTTIYAFAYLRASLPKWRLDYILHAALTALSYGLLTFMALFKVKFKWK